MGHRRESNQRQLQRTDCLSAWLISEDANNYYSKWMQDTQGSNDALGCICERLVSISLSYGFCLQNQCFVPTFILKKVMLVRRSTVDLRSWRRGLLLAGKLFCRQTHTHTHTRTYFTFFICIFE